MGAGDLASLKLHKSELLEIISLLEGDGRPSPPSPRPLDAEKPDNHGDTGDGDRGTASEERRPPAINSVPSPILEARNRRRERASALGLVARWSKEYGFISVHDPTSGEWHDLPMKEAPDWAKSEVFKRKKLKKAGGDWMITQAAMEGVFAEETRYSEFNTKAETAGGVVYEDYLGEDGDD